MRFLSLITMVCVALFIAFPVDAQEQAVEGSQAMDVVSFQRAFNEMNRIKPLQNPRYKLAYDILDRHITDSQNKIIGELEDVLINSKGEVISLMVEFDRLRLNQDVFLNYGALGVINADDSYKLPLRDEDVVNLYPELLSQIETASGTQGDVVNVMSLIGRPVINEKNKRIGKVTDILFDTKTGNHIKGVHVNVSYKTIRNEGVALPYAALQLEETYDGINVRVEQAFSDIIIQHVKN